MHQKDASQLIRRIHEQTIEKELQDLAGSTQPSYHETFKPPRALAIVKHISAQGHITVEDLDYQITKIELTPIGLKHADVKPAEHDHPEDQDHKHIPEPGQGHKHDDIDYGPSMSTILDRRVQRGFHSEAFGSTVHNGDDHGAFHIYVAESTENGYAPLHILPKHIEDDVVMVLTVEGVDYVLSEVLLNRERLQALTAAIHVNTPPRASVDLWPEEIVLHSATESGESRTYLRGDVIYYKEGTRIDRRLGH